MFLIHFFIEHFWNFSFYSKPVDVSIFGCSELLKVQPSSHKDPLSGSIISLGIQMNQICLAKSRNTNALNLNPIQMEMLMYFTYQPTQPIVSFRIQDSWSQIEQFQPTQLHLSLCKNWEEEKYTHSLTVIISPLIPQFINLLAQTYLFTSKS